MIVGDIFDKKEFEKIFARMTLDLFPYFRNKTSREIKQLKKLYEKSYRKICNIKIKKPGDSILTANLSCGFIDIAVQHHKDFINISSRDLLNVFTSWKEIKSCQLGGEMKDKVRLASAFLWEMTMMGFDEKECFNKANQIERDLKEKFAINNGGK